jgi:thiol-disulfide isomerase/thioredoxin
MLIRLSELEPFAKVAWNFFPHLEFAVMTQVYQPSKLRSLWPLGLAGLFMLTGILTLVYLGRDTARLMNAPLDEIDLKALLNTESVPSIDSLKGKVVVIHFWGTWSDSSKQAFPEFADVYRHYEANPAVTFLNVSCSPGMESDLEKLKNDTSNFLQSLDVQLPTYSDPAMFTRAKITRMLASGGFVYPFTLVTDRQGFVREYWLGNTPGSMAQLKSVVDRLLSE